MNTCDFCDQPFDEPVVGVFLRRPSDPTSVCAVMWACPLCAMKQGYPIDPASRPDPTQPPPLATYEEMEAWVEAHGHSSTPPVLWVE